MTSQRVYDAHQNIQRLLKEIGSKSESPLFGEIFKEIEALSDSEREQLKRVMRNSPLNGIVQ